MPCAQVVEEAVTDDLADLEVESSDFTNSPSTSSSSSATSIDEEGS
jgi:hypothetical protein